MIDPHAVMASLATRRPIFHSEADFQHEFAWEARSLIPSSEVRLESPSAGVGIGTTDIVIRVGETVQGVELKYLTRKHRCEIAGEVFNLKSHGAQDQRRYDILKDVQRLEHFNDLHAGTSFVITLTNDPAYWQAGLRDSTIDAAFRLHEGRLVSGNLPWAERASAGSIKNRESPLDIRGQYDLGWRDYSQLSEGGCTFRYLAMVVGAL